MKPGSANTSPPQRRLMPLALLVLAAAAAGLGAYLHFAPVRTREGDDTLGGAEGRTQADDVLAKTAPLIDRGAYGAAVDLMRAHVLTDPGDVRVRPMLIEAQLRAGRIADAERTADELLQLTPKSAEALWLKGMAVHRGGGADSVAYFRKAAEEGEGTGPMFWAKFGLLMLSEENVSEAETYLRRALAAGLRNELTLRGMGEVALRTGRFEEAAKLLADAVEHNADDADLWAELAEAQKNIGKMDAAAASVAKGLALAKTGALHKLHAEVLLLRTSLPEAAEAYAKAADFPAQAFECSLRAASTYYRLGKYALAMKYIDRAAEIKPKHPEVVTLLRKIEDARFGKPTTTQPAMPRSPFDELKRLGEETDKGD